MGLEAPGDGARLPRDPIDTCCPWRNERGDHEPVQLGAPRSPPTIKRCNSGHRIQVKGMPAGSLTIGRTSPPAPSRDRPTRGVSPTSPADANNQIPGAMGARSARLLYRQYQADWLLTSSLAGGVQPAHRASTRPVRSNDQHSAPPLIDRTIESGT